MSGAAGGGILTGVARALRGAGRTRDELTRRTLAWFPVRVWRHFLAHNGFLLAAGVSYQALFAIFAAIYVAFAIAGLVVGHSDALTENLIDLINTLHPGPDQRDGAITPDAGRQITATSTSLFGLRAASRSSP